MDGGLPSLSCRNQKYKSALLPYIYIIEKANKYGFEFKRQNIYGEWWCQRYWGINSELSNISSSRYFLIDDSKDEKT